eukprot:m.1333979 g.1333979  ORF g.1333979 m.1333979 type:complete len:127 (+) comp24872_c0_seq14:1144-1524(+)
MLMPAHVGKIDCLLAGSFERYSTLGQGADSDAVPLSLYVDILVCAGSIAPEIDEVGNQYFNGVSMIEEKTRYALDQRLGGVMIWEVGQDNFINDESALHQENSLLRAISRVIDESAPNNGAKKDEL